MTWLRSKRMSGCSVHRHATVTKLDTVYILTTNNPTCRVAAITLHQYIGDIFIFSGHVGVWGSTLRWKLSIAQSRVQDQDSLLVKRRNDNHSPGPVIRELVPSSHQRSELSNTILCIFSGWDQRIGEGIPIPDSLGEEATFINICIGNGSLKCHRVLIPTTPSFGDKVICWYTGFTFKTFI